MNRKDGPMNRGFASFRAPSWWTVPHAHEGAWPLGWVKTYAVSFKPV